MEGWEAVGLSLKKGDLVAWPVVLLKRPVTCGGPRSSGLASPTRHCSNVKDAPTKRLAALLGVLSASLSALVVRPVNTYQGFILKSTATAQTPALTVLGALTAALGAIRRSRFAMITGVLGASVGTYYITRVTASHDGLERAFGPDWKQRIRPDAERRMLQHRRSMRLPRVPAPRWARDVPFWTIPGTDRQLLADIWEPAAGVERTGTAIVYLYGGSWHFFDKDVLTRPLFRQLTAQGHVVMDAAHRSCPETDVIGMVGDVHRAVAWIKANAERYGIDPERVVVMGGSSGAHIALLAAYAPARAQPGPGGAARRGYVGDGGGLLVRHPGDGIRRRAVAWTRGVQPHRRRCGIGRSPARSPTSSTS